jgi:tetratricopeptide (TPR) repeat protein
MFGRPKPYDRQQTLASAEKARLRGRTKKAIREYRKVLAQSPGDHLVLGKLAPLLAKRGLAEEAMHSFEAAAEGLRKEGRDQRAIAVYLLAAEYYPRDQSLWERIANMQLERGTRADAVLTLLRGRQKFRRRTERSAAIALLRRALSLEEKNLDAILDLARLLGQEGHGDEALQLIEGALIWVSDDSIRRVRAAQFRIEPALGTIWHWMRGA